MLLIPKMQEERPQTQITMAKLIKANLFIPVHGLFPSKVGFERSALNVRTQAFIAQR